MKKMNFLFMGLLAIGLCLVGCSDKAPFSSDQVPTVTQQLQKEGAGLTDVPPEGFVVEPVDYPEDLGTHFVIYKNYSAWFGFNTSEQVLQAPPFNFVTGTDYIVKPMSDLALGIPAGTDVVFIPGASNGNALNQITDEKAPAAQAALDAFVKGGGCLVIVVGDNSGDAYLVPGLLGTADDALTCQGLTILDPTHPFIIGPDQIQGTGDDLNNNNIDAQQVGSLGVGNCNFCFDTHGSLAGILPGGATVHIVEQVTGKPAFAEYSLGSGKVILTTRPMEFFCDNPQILINWFFYAINLARGVEIDLDIKPQSCPNPLNTKSKGVLPVAVLGTTDLDVNDIDVSTVQLNGVAPLRSSIEDAATPVSNRQDVCDCTTDGADGFADLSLKFDTQDIVASLGAVNDGDVVQLTLTGNLNDGTAIEGVDCVVIIKK